MDVRKGSLISGKNEGVKQMSSSKKEIITKILEKGGSNLYLKNHECELRVNTFERIIRQKEQALNN
jgi:hypothetical protein